MEWTEYEALDSTSLEIQRLLPTRRPPFAVSARIQREGRGRRGRGWNSPAGNIYLSLAIDGPEDPAERSLVPVRVACLIALWLKEIAGIRLTIKWPNDLCFGTRKLGGILCESTWNGETWGPVVIGIGINCSAPPETTETGYEAVGLDSIMGSPLSGQELIRSLLKFWKAGWNSLVPVATLRTYRMFAPGSGHFWEDGAGGELHEEKGLSPDGSLRVSSLTSHNQRVLSSATHGFRWFFQGNPKAPVVVAMEKGPHFIVGVFRDRFCQIPEQFIVDGSPGTGSDAQLNGLKKILREQSLAKGWPVFSGADSPRGAAFLRAKLEPLGLRVCLLEKRPLLACHGESSPFFHDSDWRTFCSVEGWLGIMRQKGRAEKKGFGLLALIQDAEQGLCAGFFSADGLWSGPLPVRCKLAPEAQRPSVYICEEASWPVKAEEFSLVQIENSGDQRFSRMSLTPGDSSSISGWFFHELADLLACAGLRYMALGGWDRQR